MTQAKKKVISISPQLPPKVNGLGDQAWILANELYNEYGISTIFFNADTDSSEINSLTFEEEKMGDGKGRALDVLLEKHKASYIILHYVGYGYSATGCPDWLVDGLKEYKKLNPGCILITIFYELYASGMPWQKAFWIHAHQKRLAFELLELSDYSITNTDLTYKIIKNKAPHKKIIMMPVYSNIGELVKLPSFSQRENSLVLFGSNVLREKIFKKNVKSLSFWIKKLAIEKIVEIGPLRENKLGSLEGIPIIEEGVLSPEKVSAKIRNSKFGILSYPIQLLGKSGVFAAYASHGMIPIVLTEKNKTNTEIVNGLIDGANYLCNSYSSLTFEEVSKNTFNWYKDHNSKEFASQIYSLLIE